MHKRSRNEPDPDNNTRTWLGPKTYGLFPHGLSLPNDVLKILVNLSLDGIFHALKLRFICKQWRDWIDTNLCQHGLDRVLAIADASLDPGTVWLTQPRFVPWSEYTDAAVRIHNTDIPRELQCTLTPKTLLVPPSEPVVIRFFRLYRVFDYFAVRCLPAVMRADAIILGDKSQSQRIDSSYGAEAYTLSLLGTLMYYSILSHSQIFDDALSKDKVSLRLDFRIHAIRGSFLMRSRIPPPLSLSKTPSPHEVTTNYLKDPVDFAQRKQKSHAAAVHRTGRSNWPLLHKSCVIDLPTVLCFFRSGNEAWYDISSRGRISRIPVRKEQVEDEYDPHRYACAGSVGDRIASAAFRSDPLAVEKNNLNRVVIKT